MPTNNNTVGQEWIMFEDYREIVDAANVNGKFKLNENYDTIRKLSHIERGELSAYMNKKEEITNEIHKDLKQVIEKLKCQRKYVKKENEFNELAAESDKCKLSNDFHELVKKVKALL